jgi:hypothetical protein
VACSEAVLFPHERQLDGALRWCQQRVRRVDRPMSRYAPGAVGMSAVMLGKPSLPFTKAQRLVRPRIDDPLCGAATNPDTAHRFASPNRPGW